MLHYSLASFASYSSWFHSDRASSSLTTCMLQMRLMLQLIANGSCDHLHGRSISEPIEIAVDACILAGPQITYCSCWCHITVGQLALASSSVLSKLHLSKWCQRCNPRCVCQECRLFVCYHAADADSFTNKCCSSCVVWLCSRIAYPTCTSYFDKPDLVLIYWWLESIACIFADGRGTPEAAEDQVQPFGGQCGVHRARQHCSGTSADSAGGPSGPVGTSGQVSTDTCRCLEHAHQFAAPRHCFSLPHVLSQGSCALLWDIPPRSV